MSLMLRYGLIAGLSIIVFMFAPFLLFGPREGWMKYGQVLGYTWMVLSLSAVYFAMRRERDARGGIGYGRALGVGAGVAAVAGVLFGFATWGFYQIVGDTLPQAVYDFYVKNINASGADAASVAAQLAELEQMRPLFFNYPLQGVIMGATVFLIGVVLSVFAAFIVRRAARAA